MPRVDLLQAHYVNKQKRRACDRTHPRRIDQMFELYQVRQASHRIASRRIVELRGALEGVSDLSRDDLDDSPMIFGKSVLRCAVQRQDANERVVAQQGSAETAPQTGCDAPGDLPEIQARVRVQNRLSVGGNPSTQTLTQLNAQAFYDRCGVAHGVLCLEFVGGCVVDIEDAQ